MNQEHAQQYYKGNAYALSQRFPTIFHKIEKYHTQSYSHNISVRYRINPLHAHGISMQFNDTHKWVWMYSSVNPTREAMRICSNIAGEPLIIFISALGNSYLVEEVQKRFQSADIIVIERDIQLLSCALQSRDITSLLYCPQVHVCYIDNLSDIHDLVHSLYVPSLHGKACMLWNAPLIKHLYPWKRTCAMVQNSLQESFDTLSIYKKLGRRWFHNMCINGKKMHIQSAAHISPCSLAHTIAIVAAGPQLDHQLPLLHNNQQQYRNNEYAVIATDSALPILQQHNISIDACITIDSQLSSYLHFIDSNIDDIPLYTDFAIHPLVNRIASSPIPIASSHPLAVMVGQYFSFPISHRATHVTQSAFVLAATHSPPTILLYGVDYGYMHGKSYASGAYIPTHHLYHSNYLSTFESLSLFFSWQYNNDPTTLRKGHKIIPHFFSTYKEQLMQCIKEHGYTMKEEEDSGLIVCTMQQESLSQRSDTHEHLMQSLAHTHIEWEKFLIQYEECVRTLPSPHPPYLSYIQHLKQEETLTLLSLLPLMTHIRQNEHRYMHLSSTDIFKYTHQEIKKKIDALLRVYKYSTMSSDSIS